MKKYLSSTVASLSVALQNGQTARVSFSPQTEGGSVFYTDDPELQWGLEHHYRFGKLFHLVGESCYKKPIADAAAKKNAPKLKNASKKKPDKPKEPENEQQVEEEAEAADLSEVKEVQVSDMDAAKDYLAENFDVVRTKLKTEEAITEAAQSLGIVFRYL